MISIALRRQKKEKNYGKELKEREISIKTNIIKNLQVNTSENNKSLKKFIIILKKKHNHVSIFINLEKTLSITKKKK